LKYSSPSFRHDSKTGYIQIANCQPYFAPSMAEFGRPTKKWTAESSGLRIYPPAITLPRAQRLPQIEN